MEQGEQMQQQNANLEKFLQGDVDQANNLQDYNRNLVKNTAETLKDVSALTHLSNSFLDNLQKLLALISKFNEDEENTKECKKN
ncbi:hypothetical protein MNBD_GAMMA06-210 [hydrothermal vent metagenome]|uniref:Uncharacterized protein n=1 Tax=hydrothermal vent metagenome TaxID=652676 RepID=A0A3B0X0B2_9ZZZZ